MKLRQITRMARRMFGYKSYYKKPVKWVLLGRNYNGKKPVWVKAIEVKIPKGLKLLSKIQKTRPRGWR